MAWKNHAISSYKVSVGSQSPLSEYGHVQLKGSQFYALLKFVKSGSLPAATTTVVAGELRFYGFLDFQQMPVMVDLLRHESPVRFYYEDTQLDAFKVMTGTDEPIGEGE